MRSATWLAVVLPLTQACATMDAATSSAPSVVAAPATSGTPSYGISGADSYFRVEWQPDERRGKPLVSGYVTSTWGLPARNVRLRVEALDGAGALTATYIGYVSGYVTPGSHVYFEVPVRERAASYRVGVLSFDPVQGHG